MSRAAKFHALAAILLAAAWPGTAEAQTTWYVDASATPPGNGTVGSPYASIPYALAQSSTVSGDTVLVAPGTYFGNVGLSKAVTVRSAGGPQVTRILPSGPGDTVGLSNGVLDGFSVTGVGSSASVVVFMSGGTLRRCVVSGNTNGWLVGIEVLDGVIDRCTVTGNGIGIAGVAHFGGTIEIRNSIVAYNMQRDYHKENLFGPVDFCAGLDNDPYWYVSGTGNLPFDPQTHFLAFGEPGLEPGSPCIDAGDPLAPPDPDGTRADIGAVPFDRLHVPGPDVYCTAKPSSQGCTPSIGFQGQASTTSASPFLITASQIVPERLGLLFYGFGSRGVPFQGGFHCVLLPTPRTAPQSSGPGGPCGGSFSFDLNAWIQSAADARLVPGAEVCAQYWYRDPGEPTGFEIGLSDALRFAVAP